MTVPVYSEGSSAVAMGGAEREGRRVPDVDDMDTHYFFFYTRKEHFCHMYHAAINVTQDLHQF